MGLEREASPPRSAGRWRCNRRRGINSLGSNPGSTPRRFTSDFPKNRHRPTHASVHEPHRGPHVGLLERAQARWVEVPPPASDRAVLCGLLLSGRKAGYRGERPSARQRLQVGLRQATAGLARGIGVSSPANHCRRHRRGPRRGHRVDLRRAAQAREGWVSQNGPIPRLRRVLPHCVGKTHSSRVGKTHTHCVGKTDSRSRSASGRG